MMTTTFIWLFPLATLSASLAVGLAHLMGRRRAVAARSIFHERQDPGLVFLFDGRTLVDATDSARALLGPGRAGQGEWARLMAHLAPQFPDLEAEIAHLPERGRIRLTGQGNDPLTLLAEWRGGLRRITLSEPHSEGQTMMLDAMALRAQETELDALRRTADAAPMPICREAADGRVLWANAAYVDLAMRLHGPEAALTWPMPILFGSVPPDGRLRLRLEVPVQANEDHGSPPGSPDTTAAETIWFDCCSVRGDGGRIVYALPANAAVRAEESLHNFLLALTRTFAHLPLGLAIFDQQRRLQMFNPALTDLTRLPVGFLSARPTLFAVIDAMRERGILPEPRDYKQWRRKIASLEGETLEDFQETWVLAEGTSYRFTARPQSEGTLALLIEDITDDMLRTRSHNAHVELGQAVIDSLDEAIAVFDTSGALVMSNARLDQLWGDAAQDDLLSGPEAPALLARWQEMCAPHDIWRRLGDFIATPGDRGGCEAEVRLRDGRALRVRAVAVSGQASLIGFAPMPAVGRSRPVAVGAFATGADASCA